MLKFKTLASVSSIYKENDEIVDQPSGGDGHCTSTAQYLELYWCALNTGDAEGYATVVYLVVAEFLST